MSTSPPSPAVLDASDLKALLGLREGADPARWGRIRAFQLHAGRRLAWPLLAANLLAAVSTVLLAWGLMPAWKIGCWAVLLGAVSLGVTLRRLATRHRGDGYADVRDLRATVGEGVALAAAWAIVPLVFCRVMPDGTVGGLGVILVVLMTAAALAMAPLALATLAFLAGIGAAIVVPLAVAHAYPAALGVVIFTAILMTACMNRARSLMAIRATQYALAERDATVSLLLREFEDQNADWLWETDAARRVVKASPRFAYACGLDPLAINGLPFLQVLAGPSWDSGEVAPGLRTLAEKMKTRDSFRDLRLPVVVDGEERWWEIAASPRFDESGAFAGFRGVGSDVTEQRATADKINRLARFDVLTGLPNRLSINEVLGRAITEADKWGNRCGFMMIDLDRFKAVNDTLGHPVGDRLLGRVSERLSQLATQNEIVGRLGGDEFAVVVRDASDPTRVERFARQVVDTLSRPYEVDQHTLHIGASVGVATGPRDGRTAEMLIRSADLALYRSKDVGGGAVHHYEPQLHAEAEERRVLEMALRKALELGQMHLNYQPVVDAGTGNLTGFEALLRWVHPDFGNVSPVKFIPLAEEARLIAPIGEWVLRTACEEAARWPDTIRIAVNVSPEQLHNPGFVATVTSALAQSGLPAERLELEVTESVFMREGTGAVQALERILDMGVRLSLDDFGTGYSSLGYLSRTRFSTIKVDRSFVTAASKGVREAVAIIRAVVALAKSLGMATTAEGVETEKEHLMVQEFGCSKVQGYYFGRPLPVTEARALATQKRWSEAA